MMFYISFDFAHRNITVRMENATKYPNSARQWIFSMTLQQFTGLTEMQLPLSPVFIDFVARWLDSGGFAGERWFDQRSETLSNQRREIHSKARHRLQRILSDESAHSAIESVYRHLNELASTRGAKPRRALAGYRFIAVVGAPRTGGSYLTAELFRALGYNPAAVPAAIAHDGFPEAKPISISNGSNAWLGTLASTSQYLTMVELFFSQRQHDRPIVVPKKLTKSVYAGSFFNTLLGRDAEYLITIRNPIGCCVSMYEKSGGFPADGLFKARSTMERWVGRDLLHTGVTRSELASMEYFAAYVRYWEQYYINLAMSGLTANRTRSVVAFGEDNMEEAALVQHGRLGSTHSVGKFVAPRELHARHPQWIRRSEEAMERVAAVWRLVGLPFPAAEL